jgi:hypothetical protein
VKIHIISDLFLGFSEFGLEEEQIPDVDLVIINGNIGPLKRSVLYTETLCNKYPDTQFIMNLGLIEQSWVEKYFGENHESIEVRKKANVSWPKNLHYGKEQCSIHLRDGDIANVLCAYGFPKIHSISGNWTDTMWHKYHFMNIAEINSPEGEQFKPKETSDVLHGVFPIPATKDWINQQHNIEWQKVKKWEVTPITGRRILVTHINPYKDSRSNGCTVSPYLIHLEHGTWIASDTTCNGVTFLGGKLYANPGRGPEARSKVITIN